MNHQLHLFVILIVFFLYSVKWGKRWIMWRMLEPLMKSFLKRQSGMFNWRIFEAVFHERNYVWTGPRHFVYSPDPTSIIAPSISLQKVFITFTNNSKKKTSIITQSRKNLVWLTGLNYKQPKSKIPHRKTNEEFLWSVISNRHSNQKKKMKNSITFEIRFSNIPSIQQIWKNL